MSAAFGASNSAILDDFELSLDRMSISQEELEKQALRAFLLSTLPKSGYMRVSSPVSFPILGKEGAKTYCLSQPLPMDLQQAPGSPPYLSIPCQRADSCSSGSDVDVMW